MTSLIGILNSHVTEQALRSLHDAITAIERLPVPAHYMITHGRKDAVEAIRGMIKDIKENGLKEVLG